MKRAPRNRTVELTDDERRLYSSQLLTVEDLSGGDCCIDRIINADLMQVLDALPESFVDLLVIDPPYNITKEFNTVRFSRLDDDAYYAYVCSWLPGLLRACTPDASVYLCGDWRSASVLFRAAQEYLTVRNRITWQREKGRGAARNWKNCSEDIWFATRSNYYHFDVDAVKMKRRVIAPYTVNGQPKDWQRTPQGDFRLTSPSNFWDDLTVPYWSMPENTIHPTQKPEKLIAKLVLASCRPGGVVFDPFTGSGTTAVVARKLGRRFCGVEIDPEYCCLTLKRLARALQEPAIQGYADGVFWERNTHIRMNRPKSSSGKIRSPRNPQGKCAGRPGDHGL